MGATFIYITAAGDHDPVESFLAEREYDLYEHGHSPYSGTFGTMTGVSVNRTAMFESFAEAESFVEANAEKWEKAVAVRYRDNNAEERWFIGGWAAC